MSSSIIPRTMIIPIMFYTTFMTLPIKAYALACEVDGPHFFFGEDGVGKVTAYRDTPCTFNMQWLENSHITSFKIALKPKHGFAGVSHNTGWAYKPSHGFIGPDQFVYEVTGYGIYHKGTSRITYDIDVLDR